jgi:hypothetical protein
MILPLFRPFPIAGYCCASGVDGCPLEIKLREIIQWDFKSRADFHCFGKIQPTLTNLVFTDKALWYAQAFSNISLGQPPLFSNLESREGDCGMRLPPACGCFLTPEQVDNFSEITQIGIFPKVQMQTLSQPRPTGLGAMAQSGRAKGLTRLIFNSSNERGQTS